MHDWDTLFYGEKQPAPTREQIVQQLYSYATQQLSRQQGTILRHMVRHYLGLTHGLNGAKIWRRMLSDADLLRDNRPELILEAWQQVEKMQAALNQKDKSCISPTKNVPWLPWLFGLLLIGGLLLAFYLLGNVLTPFIVAAVLAYILDPLVSKIEKLGIHRSRASMWVMLFAFFVIIGLLLVIVPMLVEQFQSIVQKIPKLVDYVQTKLVPWFNQKFGEHIALNEKTIANWLRSNMAGIQAACNAHC